MDGFPVFEQLRLPREQVIEVVIDRSVHIEISELYLTYHRSCHKISTPNIHTLYDGFMMDIYWVDPLLEGSLRG